MQPARANRGAHSNQSHIPIQKPNTQQDEVHVYVLTLKLTASIAIPMNEMREVYFPPHLNRIPAHLTLFHALPHSQLSAIEAYLDTIASHAKPFTVSTGVPFRMGRGVGIGLSSGGRECVALHDALRDKWVQWLSDQDRGGWKPHWTVMNKETDEKKVKDAFNSIRRDLFENEYAGSATGLDLWRYDGGGWQWTKNFKFAGNGRVDPTSLARNNSIASPQPGEGNKGQAISKQEDTQKPSERGKRPKEKTGEGRMGIKRHINSMGFRKESQVDSHYSGYVD